MSYKIFNGKRYTLQDTDSNKKKLLRAAERLRRKTEDGRRQNARVVKVSENKYSLYTRNYKV